MSLQSLHLVRDLYARSAPANRCPHLEAPTPLPACRAPIDGCHCRAVRPLMAAMVCDTASLQLWCLAGPERWPKCLYYREPTR
jgi:hypothetical protein